MFLESDKKCPLKLISGEKKGSEDLLCERQCCEWWNASRTQCIIFVVADALDDIATEMAKA